MALATRPKPKVHHKKRQAQHHRQTKPYLKAYWPYLPLFAVVGMGAGINKYWASGDATTSVTSVSSPTRIEALVGVQNTWALSAVVVIAGLAFAVLLFQNWFRIHRLLNKGEAFIVKHPWFDVALAVIATAGVLLTRGSVIH